MLKTAFIGHRDIFVNDIYERLNEVITSEIESGCNSFTMGTHGKFDCLALSACRQLRKTFPKIEIEVVITNLNILKKGRASQEAPYSDVKTVMYEIEEAHYKQQIILSNKQMIDTCDTLICYVNSKHRQSGAKMIMNYAKRNGLRIINLYREEDDILTGMTNDQIKKHFESISPNQFNKE